MGVIEKILEEIEEGAHTFEILGRDVDFVAIDWVRDVIRKRLNDAEYPYITEKDVESVPTASKEFLAECREVAEKYGKNDGWIPVEERLPDEEAEEYIKKKLHGIGYLYPCLVTYRSPMTERIHVVRFYYDIYEHWFVNAGEEVCEKERCIAWRPLPEPYHPERSEE